MEGHGLQRIVEYLDDDVVDRPVVKAEREARLGEPLQSVVRLGDRYVRDDGGVAYGAGVAFKRPQRLPKTYPLITCT